MEEKLSAMYKSIAQQTVNLIFDNWDKIYLLGEVEKTPELPVDESVGYALKASYYYIDAESKEVIRGIDEHANYISFSESQALNKELRNSIHDLNKVFRAESQGDWSKIWDAFTLTIDNTGKFSMDYHYNFKDEHEDIFDKYNLNREFVWAYRTCGFKAEEGHPYRTNLEKYLQDQESRPKNSAKNSVDWT